MLALSKRYKIEGNGMTEERLKEIKEDLVILYGYIYRIIKSEGSGIMQHDRFLWLIENDDFAKSSSSI